MNKTLWRLTCAMSALFPLMPLSAMAAVKNTTSTNVVKSVYWPDNHNLVVETDQKYRQRQENLQQLADYYHIDWTQPYVFIGQVRQETIEKTRAVGGAGEIQRVLTPEYYAEVYQVHSTGVPHTRFVYIDKRHARARTFNLQSDEVKLAADFTSVEQRIVMAHMHAGSSSERQSMLKFARRLIASGICHTVIAGFIDNHHQVILTCGDGMKYYQTLAQIEQGVAIQRRVVSPRTSF